MEEESLQVGEKSFVLHPTLTVAIKEFRVSADTDRIYTVYFTDTNDGFERPTKIPEHEIKPVSAWGVQNDSLIRWVAP